MKPTFYKHLIASASLLAPLMLAAQEAPTMTFPNLAMPSNDAQKRQIRTVNHVMIDGQRIPLSYTTLGRSGERIGDQILGQSFNEVNPDAPKRFISNHADYSALFKRHGEIYLTTHFEDFPGSVYLSTLTQNQKGDLRIKATKPVDFSKVHGIWVPCSGSITPWQSHLSSEEYEPDAKSFDYTLAYKPYHYGWTPEITVLDNKGNADAVKHFAMGRFSHELSYVMPDRRTVYMSDDGGNVGFFMFVADRPGDLDEGTLYAARWKQMSAKAGGSALLEWVNLGHADSETIEKAINRDIKFTEIFDEGTIQDGQCEAGFSSINTSNGHECLRVKKGMEKLASRLETRRYAAIKGATTEFMKEEGITFDPHNNMLYVAMTRITGGMLENDSVFDKGGYDHIRLEENLCGAVYMLNLQADRHDSRGVSIESEYVAVTMRARIAGVPTGDKTNYCAIDAIANPDNISYIPAYDILLMSEDSKFHENNMLWAYDIRKNTLSRLQTLPKGAESTSAYFYNEIGGYGYILSVVQHPFDVDFDPKTQEEASSIGYIGPFPKLDLGVGK